MPVNEIQVGRYNAILHKLLDMKEGAPAPVLAPEIFAVLELEGRPEQLWLGGVQMGIARAARAADVGNYSFVYLTNPSGSGVIATVDWILQNAADGYVDLRQTVHVAGGSQGVQLDSRAGNFPTIQATALQTTTGIAVAQPGTAVAPLYVLQGHKYELPFVLIPNSSIAVASPAVNTAVDVVFRWRERVFEPSESR